MPFSRQFLPISAAAVMLAVIGCTPSADKCIPFIDLQPAPNKAGVLTLPANSSVELTATVAVGAKCPAVSPTAYDYLWYYDDDGDLVLSDAELSNPVTASTYRLFACPSDVGRHLLRVEAIPVAAETPTPIVGEFNVDIVNAPPQTKPACVQTAIQTVQNMQEVNAETVGPLEEALGCLDPYLDTVNICDVQASYAAGLAKFGVFNAKTPGWFRDRNDLSEQDVVDIFDTYVMPMLNRFELVKREADESFSFYVDGQFNVFAFEDQPDLEGDQTQFIVLQGDHDYTDVWAISVANNITRVIFNMMLAYEGLLRWLLDYPALGEVQDFSDFRQLFLDKIIDDPTFLTLTEDGPARLLSAQRGLIDFFNDLEVAVNLVIRETDNQYDDLLRYWDCGTDRICDCTKMKSLNGSFDVPVNNFLACPNDQSLYEGPDADGTEGNGKYDKGELIGTDRLGNKTQFETIDLPSNVDEFTEQLRLLRDNVRGPDALDLDKLAGGGGIPVTVFLSSTLGLPVPEIRLSEWFVTPANPRDLVPLYSKSKRDFVFDIEGEPFEDVGYDGIPNELETIKHWPNPRGLPIGTPYDRLTNPDPHFDDLDPFCNPICNSNDGIDNDGDGLVDNADVWIVSGVDIDTDLGVENNLTFDWIDFNGNFTHDPGEPSEPFEDIGVLNYRGELVGAGNGVWNFADRAHTFPKGDDIGPFGDIDQIDPPNGTRGYVTTDKRGNPIPVPDDQSIRNAFSDIPPGSLADYDGLYDSFYFFFPEPTFSGVLKFPEDIPGLDNTSLTENAKLMRFFSKILEIAATIQGVGGKRVGDEADVPPREAYGHVCSNEAACIESLCTWVPTHNLCTE